MPNISKTDAFQCVVNAMDAGDYKSANEILEIISKSTVKDRKNKTFMKEIELKNKKEIKLFQQYTKVNN